MMKITLKTCLSAAATLLIPIAASSQVIKYKRSTLELKVGVGGTSFFGDLGGSHGAGKQGFLDFDIQSMRGNSSVGLKFNLTNKLSLRTDFCYGEVMGSDAFSGEPGRFKRNLSFRSDIYEFSVTPEIVLVNLSRFGRNKLGTSEIYGFLGYGTFWFNPQSQLDGQWHDLQPLGTEGQGIDPNKDFYSLQAWVIPFGFGYRKNVTRSIYLGLELSMRKTSTDYIDDVSGTYCDVEAIREERGDIAAQLSHRNLDGPVGANTQRGNPLNNDSYSFIQFTVAVGFGKKETTNSKPTRFVKKMKHRDRCPKLR